MPEQLQIKNWTPSKKCVDLIKGFESLFLRAYQGEADRKGLITIGYGTIKYPNGTKPKLGDKITAEQAADYLSWEVRQKSGAVDKLIKGVPITQNMYDALVSFVYNLGEGALEESTLLKKLKINPLDATIYNYSINKNTGWGTPNSCEFLRWVNSDGKQRNGLIRRRTSEANLYISGELDFFE